jgi:UDP:flavonoid glycosyltransferase YjiC (YdhE family)
VRVLFTSWAWPTHYFPMVPLGWAFLATGHEVRVASQPGLSDTITRSGLPAVAVGRDVDFTALFQRHLGGVPAGNGEGQPDWVAMRRRKGMASVMMFVDLAESMTAELIAFARAWRPDLIVYEPTTYAGPLAAAAAGVPAARHLWAADFTYRGRELERQALAPMAERYDAQGFEPLGTVTVDPCPPAMQTPSELRRQPVRYIPYNGPGVMPHWLLEPRRARRRVCVTWGTASFGLSDTMFLAPHILAALAAMDLEVIAAISPAQRDALGVPPANARAVESLPLHMLLPTCDALIHQGGGGTMMTGVRSGLPQLVVPQLPDQTFFSEQLVSAGAGVLIRREDVSGEAIRAAVTDLLEQPSYRASAQMLRRQMLSQPAPAEVATALERLASSHSAGVAG